MIRTLRKLALLPLLPLLLLAITACEQAGDPTAAVAPTSADPLIGSLLGAGSNTSYTLVTEPILSLAGNALSTSAFIGFSGGEISLLGHVLAVPAGAVSSTTLFTLTVLPRGYVEVNLRATANTLSGVLGVGSNGLAKPVLLSLTYERGTNFVDPHELTVLRLNSRAGYADYDVMRSTVDTSTKKVTAPLDQFARYILAHGD